MRKSAVWILFIFLITMMPSLPVSSATEKLTNGGFEEALSGWSENGGSFGTEFTMEMADVVEGEEALCISSSGDACVSQGVSLTPDGVYALSGYIRVKALSAGGYAALKTEIPNADKTYAHTEADNRWKPFSYVFTAPADAQSMNLLLRIVGSGTVYFDDVRLSESGTVQNGSFSQVDDGGRPVGWTASDGWGTMDAANETLYESVTAAGYDGRGVLITNFTTDKKGNPAGERNPYISCSFLCESSANYTLSGFFKADADYTVGVKIEDYRGSDNFAGKTYSLVGNGGWMPFSIDFSTALEETRVSILLRVFGKGEAAFDEIALTYNGKKDEEVLRVEPEDIFAYTDKTEGSAVVSVFRAKAATNKIELAILDGEALLWTETKTAAETVYFSYDNREMTTLQKGYTLRARLLTGGGSVLAESSETIYRYPRPTHLNPEGFFVNHDGQAVYPVTAYHVPLGDYEKLAEIGVNVVQCIYTSAYPDSIAAALDKAEKLGLYLMIPLYADMKTAGSDHNRERTVACIERFKNHPALYAWMVMDEPQPYYDAVYEELKASYKLIRDLDPAHPVYICECNPESYALSGRCCDILCVDPYPDTPEDMARVYDDTVLALEATNYEKPVYNLLQAWKWTEWEPSAGELRQMIYQALFAGAAAYGYYPIRDSSSTMYNLPLWSGAVSFAAYEKEALYKAFLEGDAPKVQKTDTCYYAESGSYIFVINRTGNETSVTIPTSLSGTPVLINGAAEVQKSTEGITVQLSDFGAACIEMTDEARVSLWKDGMRAHRVESGTYAVKTANETEGQIFTALYEEVNGKRELMNLVVGAATFAVDCKNGKKYEIRVYHWKDGVPQTEIFAIS